MLEQTGVPNPPQPPQPAETPKVGSGNDGKLNLPNMKKLGTHKIDVAQGAVSSIYFVIGALVGAVALTGYLMYAKSATVMATEQAQEQYRTEVETKLNDELFIAQKKEVLEVGSQIDLLQESLTNRLLFSKVLDDIQVNTYKQTRYLKVNMIEEGDIEITGSVSEFLDMAKAVAALRSATTISDLELTNVDINTDEDTIEYTLRGKINLDTIKPTTQTKSSSNSSTTPEIEPLTGGNTVSAIDETTSDAEQMTTSSPLGN